jgi:hypothetical protein
MHDPVLQNKLVPKAKGCIEICKEGSVPQSVNRQAMLQHLEHLP